MGWWPRARLPVLGAMIVLAGAVALFVLSRRSGDTKTEEAVAVSAPAPFVSASATIRSHDSPLGDLTRVDASDLYPKIKERAAQWSTGARLISISASPVVGSKVDLSATGGEIVYQFAAGFSATGREQPAGRLALRVTRDGIKPAPASEPANVRPETGRDPLAAPIPTDPGEPNCVSEAAAKVAHASGIPANTAMKLRYEVDRTLRRGVWTAKVDGRRDLDRVIDGKTCAIVTRR
jgi:hypothetical protein